MMSLWHADMDTPLFAHGAGVTVFSPHHVVRVITADEMSIEIPDGSRLSAQVLDRTGDHMTLVLPDGSLKKLSILSDDSLHPVEQDKVFSRQHWVVN